MTELIYIHIPKTGGSGVRVRLSEVYGESEQHHIITHTPFGSDSYFIDPESVMFKDHPGFRKVIYESLRGVSEPAVLYAHLPVWVLEDVLPGVPRITVVRDPIEHIFSSVFFWKNSNPDHPKSKLPGRELAFDPMFLNTQFLYVGGIALRNFALVGITETLGDFLNEAARMFVWPEGDYDIHIGEGPRRFREERDRLRSDKELCDALRKRNYLDVALYDLAKSRWS